MPAAGQRTDVPSLTVTISYAGFNQAWAAWIASRLERRGQRAAMLRWDPPEGVPLDECLRDLLLAPGPVLVVLSDWYLQAGSRSRGEWARALRSVVANRPGRFAAVLVTTAVLPPATAVFAAADLATTRADEAERRLLVRLGLPAEPLTDAPESPGAPRYPLATPHVWSGVPRRNTRFTGRESLLDTVYRSLRSARRGAEVVTLHGMAGVGKTQLAAEYVYRFGAEYDVVWWVSADDRGTCRQRLAELAPALGLPTRPDYGERLRAVADALLRGRPYERWLLVLDGADEPEEVQDLVPTGTGHVLITAQNAEWIQHNSLLVEVTPYARDESVAFVRRRAPRLGPVEADQLAEALEDLPLLLDQTAGWLNDSEMSVEEYIRLLTEGSVSAVASESVRLSADFPVPFAKNWSILLERLSAASPDAVDLLRLCVFFAPASIPVGWVRQVPPDDVPERLRPIVRDANRWYRALDTLRQYAIVRTGGPGEQAGQEDVPASAPAAPATGHVHVLYMHRLVHRTVVEDIPADERATYARLAQAALVRADPGVPEDAAKAPYYAEIIPHLEPSEALRSTDPDVQDLVMHCLRHMYVLGDDTEGSELARETTAIWSDVLGPVHPRTWELSHHYTNLLWAVGSYHTAEQVSRGVYNHLLTQRGGRDLAFLRASDGLAAALRGLGQYDEAQYISEVTLRTYRSVRGEVDELTVNARNNLAVSRRLLGEYAPALKLTRRVLTERRSLLGPDHRTTLYSELQLATELRLLGRFDEALGVAERNRAAHEEILGPDNQQTLEARYNLAQCRYLADPARPDDETAALFADVADSAEREMGERHPETLRYMAGHSCFAREHQDIDRARDLSERVVAGYLTMLGPDHPYTVGVRANHALLLRALGEGLEAHDQLEDAFIDMTTLLGETHPWTLGCALNAAVFRMEAGETEGAAKLAQVTVRRASDQLERNHPLTLLARRIHAAVLRVLGDAGEAAGIDAGLTEDLRGAPGAVYIRAMAERAPNRVYWDFEPAII